jgi:hypothetical protein
VDFTEFNLNSPERQALWQQERDLVQALLEQIKADVFDGQASIEGDYVARFSGLAKPNLALGTTTELAGFIAVCCSPEKVTELRVLASNGHTAVRYDTPPEELEKALAMGLRRWLSQPMYRQIPAAP